MKKITFILIKLLLLFIAFMLIPPFVNYIVETPSSIGFITETNKSDWISFIGVILSIYATIAIFIITSYFEKEKEEEKRQEKDQDLQNQIIKEKEERKKHEKEFRDTIDAYYSMALELNERNELLQKQINMQESLRRDDLAIQYKPFLSAKYITKDTYPSNTTIKNKDFQGWIEIKLGETLPNKLFFLNVELKNYGDGECCLYIEENTTLNTKNESINYCFSEPSDDLQHIYLTKGYVNTIPRNDSIYFQIKLFYNDSENFDNNILEISIPLLYKDQFSINQYDANLSLIFDIQKKSKKIYVNDRSINMRNLIISKDQEG